MKGSCGKPPLSRRKSPFRERLRLMKFQAYMWCKVPKRERKIYKLDSNIDRPSFPAVTHLFMLHHLMVHVHSLFGASVALLGELLSPKSPSLQSFWSERSISTSPMVTERLFLFFLFVPVKPSSPYSALLHF